MFQGIAWEKGLGSLKGLRMLSLPLEKLERFG
jgi:hypothetical protein